VSAEIGVEPEMERVDLRSNLLSRQEERVLALAVGGKADREIAEAMGLTPETVRTYWHRIRRKRSGLRRSEIVAQARSEAELREFEARPRDELTFLEAVLDTAGCLVCVGDSDGRVIRFNAECERLTGWTEGEMLGRDGVEALVPFEVREEVRSVLRRLTPTVPRVLHENEWVTKDGSRRVVEWRNTAVFDADGQVRYLVATGVDVTERRVAEEELRVRAASRRLAEQVTGFGMYDIDLVQRRAHWSTEFKALLGLAPDQAVTDDEHLLPRAVHPDDLQMMVAATRDAVDPNGSGTLDGEHRIVLPDGRIRWLSVRGQSFFSGAGASRRATRVIGGAQDITAQKELEQRLRESEERERQEREFLQAVLGTAGTLVCVLDPEGRFVQFNKACESLTGWQTQDVLGQPFWQVVVPPDERGMVTEAFDRLKRGQFPMEMENHWITRDGRRRLIEWRNTGMLGPEGEVRFIVATGVDATERRAAQRALAQQARQLEELSQRLAQLATTDELTGLANRRVLGTRLAYEVERARRLGSELSLIVVDVDRFKTVNDMFGHDAGDETLRRVAQVLQRGARRHDLVARPGGEEFAVMCPDTGRQGAEALAERLREALEMESWPARSVTASFGVATAAGGAADAGRLRREADRAMYAAKAGGRNQTVHAASLGVLTEW